MLISDFKILKIKFICSFQDNGQISEGHVNNSGSAEVDHK